MRISFDLDDTLTAYSGPKETGQKGIVARFLYKEPLRFGIRDLLTEFICNGHQIFIYTTSMRPPKSIIKWFRSYGIFITDALNGLDNSHVIKGRPLLKNPDAFDFDIHFDDETITLDKNYKLKCMAVVIDRNDLAWCSKVMQVVADRHRDVRDVNG